jgi:hypothetical protein
MGLTNTWRDILQLPEMLRVPLVELCLQIKILRLGSVVSFLERVSNNQIQFLPQLQLLFRNSCLLFDQIH